MSIKENAEINTLIMSSCKVKEIEDKTIVQLVLYTDAEKKEVNKERVARVFGNRMLATEIFEIDQRKVEEEQIKYLKKFLKKKEIKDELLNDFEVTDISIHKKGKRTNLKIEICSSRFKEFMKKKNNDRLTLNNLYEKFKEHLQTKNDCSEFELDNAQIEAFARFPKPLDDIKRSCPDSKFTFEFTKKSKKLFKKESDLKYFDEFYEKVAKVRLPYIIPDNFKLPRLMIYNALLAMINSGEDELETLYGDKEVKFSKDNDMLIIKFGDKTFDLQSRPVSKVIASLKTDNKSMTIENSFLEGIITNSIDIVDESSQIDTVSKYIWECLDEKGEFSDKVAFPRTEKEWCPYDQSNLSGIQKLESEFQRILELVKDLRSSIEKELDNDKPRLEKQEKQRQKKRKKKEEKRDNRKNIETEQIMDYSKEEVMEQKSKKSSNECDNDCHYQEDDSSEICAKFMCSLPVKVKHGTLVYGIDSSLNDQNEDKSEEKEEEEKYEGGESSDGGKELSDKNIKSNEDENAVMKSKIANSIKKGFKIE